LVNQQIIIKGDYSFSELKLNIDPMIGKPL